MVESVKGLSISALVPPRMAWHGMAWQKIMIAASFSRIITDIIARLAVFGDTQKCHSYIFCGTFPS